MQQATSGLSQELIEPLARTAADRPRLRIDPWHKTIVGIKTHE
jgi:hypothetical protein